MFLSVSLKMILGIVGALLLNAKLKGRSAFRVWLCHHGLCQWQLDVLDGSGVYNGHFGILAGVLMHLGILDGPFEFLAYKTSAFYSTVVTDVWIGTPMVTLFLLAAMQGVSQDLYEAAMWMVLQGGIASAVLRYRRSCL